MPALDVNRAQRPSGCALEGITVISLEHAVSAPFATRLLADMGARVIKIERPGVGDFARAYDERVRGLSSYFVWCNRAKQSLTLDVKQPAAAGILAGLLAKADVLVQNLAPGATERLGLSFEQLNETHPRLIVCDISGYGGDGPYRDRKAYDLLIQSESGFVSVTGTPEAPAKAGCSIADISAGMFACNNILAALIERGRTGKGRRIDLSMLECMAEWMGNPMYYAFEGAEPPPRTGAAHASIYPYGPFETGDGASVLLGLQNEREWAVFCEKVLGMPELTTDPRFSTNSRRSAARAELHSIVVGVFSRLNSAEAAGLLDGAQIANARVNEMRDLWAHPQLEARSRWVTVATPAGDIPALLPPGMTDANMASVPALGEHTNAILAELGYSAEAIARLHAEAVV